MKNKYVMILSKYDNIRKPIRYVLKQNNINNISEVLNLSEALKEIKKIRFSIVFIDLELINSAELLAIKGLFHGSRSKDTHIVLLVSGVSKKELNQFIKLGINDLILKPFTPDVIESKINKLLISNKPIRNASRDPIKEV